MRRQGRYARGVLIWCLTGFVALQVGMGVVSEFWIVRLRDPVYGPKISRLQQRLREQPRSPLVVVVGSSRVADALDGQLCEQAFASTTGKDACVFNLGIPGSVPMQTYLNVRRMLADGVRPDLVLVEVMLPLLDARIGAIPLWMPSERLGNRDLRFLREGGLPCADLHRAAWEDRLFPWHSRRFVILSMTQPRLLPAALRQNWARSCDASGGVPRDDYDFPPEAYARALEHARREYEAMLQSFQLGGASCDAVQQTLQACRAANVPAAIVLTPEGTAFRSWYSPAALAQSRAFVGQLERDFGVPVIDAREWLGDEDFVDSHHARKRGAKAFSGRLGSEVLPGLLGDRATAR